MKPNNPHAAAETPELAHCGILRVASESFDFDGHVHASLADALAQAKSVRKPGR